jgi:hypothetical protein
MVGQIEDPTRSADPEITAILDGRVLLPERQNGTGLPDAGRSYGQFRSVATALDAGGDRWAPSGVNPPGSATTIGGSAGWAPAAGPR